MVFVDRTDAGKRLGARLLHLKGPATIVLGLPRGGVVVAYEVAVALDAPLDVIVVRKLGVPFQPDLAMGAIGEGGVRVLNDEVIRIARMSPADLAAVESQERAELERRASRLRRGHPPLRLDGHIVVVVDDGIATGSTVIAACRVARIQGAQRLVVAVPVVPKGWEERVRPDIDELVCLESPEQFFAIGQFYADFSQTSEDDVVDCLSRAARQGK